MSGRRLPDPWGWPALAGAPALPGAEIACDIGIWGKVHGQASDYRWIARSDGFGDCTPDLHRSLRLGAEDLAVRTTAWRAPAPGCGGADSDYFAIGAYPSRALDAAGRSAVLEKQVLHWRRPAPGFPVALAAAALLPTVALADDRSWWDRVGEGDWRRPDQVLRLAPAACPRLRLGRVEWEALIADGIEALAASLDEPRLAAVYAGLLAGLRPVQLGGLAVPLPPGALAALLLPLSAAQAAGCSLCAGVPATLVDPRDLGHHWDLIATRQAAPSPAPAPGYLERGARLAAALYARDPGLIPRERATLIALTGAPDGGAGEARPAPHGPLAAPSPGDHPHPRLQLPSAAGLGYLHEFAEGINLRRLDLSRLAADLVADRADQGAWPPLAPDADPAGHPLIRWIAVLEAQRPASVAAADWAFKIDQLRAAALFLLPHPRTLELVGLPRDPRVPALLAVLAADPGAPGCRLAFYGVPALRRLLGHSRTCPDDSLVSDLRDWVRRWLAGAGDPELTRTLGDLL